VTPPLRAADLPERVFRLGRAPEPWDWPDWRFGGDDGGFGNRFDDPDGEYRVLYASTERETTFRECLARFRPDPAILAAAIEENDVGAPATVRAGSVPASWLRGRRMGSARPDGRFCDIGHSDSLAHLRHHLAHRLVHFGLDDLDAGDIRTRAPRRLTQELSRFVFVQANGGAGAFAGVRYASRLGDELTNWAIFEPNEPTHAQAEEISSDDPDLLVVLRAYDLTLIND
jgi:hypothetical protein